MKLRIGTRESPLALAQARTVEKELHRIDPSLSTELVLLKTTGDRRQDLSFSQIGEKGLFVKELEIALQKNQVDLAVHSVKDLPAVLPSDLELCAFPPREDPRDVLLTRENLSLDELPENSIIGTSAVRRKAQLLHFYPALQIQLLRGNVETRIRKLVQNQYFGIVLAKAGLTRLGIKRGAVISPDLLLPAPGQGAIALEIRKEDRDRLSFLSRLNHEPTQQCILAERGFLQTMEGGCSVPLGALARIENQTLILRGLLAAPDGSRMVRQSREGSPDQAWEIGKKLGEEIRLQGESILTGA